MTIATSPNRRRTERLADRLVEELEGDAGRIRALTDALDRRVRTRPLERLLELWDLSQSEAARFFGVSRQALSQWLRDAPPASRADQVADLAVATDLLDRHVKRERIAAVVRRGAPMLEGRSLLDLARDGRHREVREAVERMFELRRVQP